MKKSLKTIMAISLAALLVIGAGGCNKAEAAEVTATPDNTQTTTVEQTTDAQKIVPISGKIESITAVKDAAGNDVTGKSHIQIVDSKDSAYVFVIDENTINITATKAIDKLAVGDSITCYYDQNLPAIMIYPPQYSAVAIATVPGDTVSSIKIDTFDQDLLSSDKQLKLTVGDDTKIYDSQGNAYDKEIKGQLLMVVYQLVATSEPAQATPSAIYVLPAQTVEPVDPSSFTYLVAGKTITAPNSFFLSDGSTLMVPLRAISEALDYQVGWDQTAKAVTLNGHVSLTIGKDAYNFGKMAPISLGAAPQLINGVTYVPLKFFKDVLQLNNAYLFEGQIVVNNDEAMQ